MLSNYTPTVPILEAVAAEFAVAPDTHPYLFEELARDGGRTALEQDRSAETAGPATDEEWITVHAGRTGPVRARVVRPQGIARWVAAEGDQYGLDNDRIAIAGAAVGNMTIAATLMAEERGDISFVQQVLFYRVTGSPFGAGSQQFAEGYFLRRDGVQWFWDEYRVGRQVMVPVEAIVPVISVRAGRCPGPGFDPDRVLVGEPGCGDRHDRREQGLPVPVRHRLSLQLVHEASGGGVRQSGAHHLRAERRGWFSECSYRLRAGDVASDDRYVWLNQCTNTGNWRAHYQSTAPAIARQFSLLDVLFVGAGTTGTLMAARGSSASGTARCGSWRSTPSGR